MRLPALPALAVGTLAALTLTLSGIGAALADDLASPEAAATAAATEAPADPTAPVVADETSTDPDEAVAATDEASDISADAAEPTATEDAPAEATNDEVVAEQGTQEDVTPAEVVETPADQSGDHGAYSYPFFLTTAEDGTSTVAIEVAGVGISVGYTLDSHGKVLDAVVTAGDATLAKATPHTIKLVLDTGERVMIKVHGDSVRVKVKPRKGGPLRPGIATSSEVASDEAAEAQETEEPEAAEETETEHADKAEKSAKTKHAEKSQANKGKSSDKGSKGKHSGKHRG